VILAWEIMKQCCNTSKHFKRSTSPAAHSMPLETAISQAVAEVCIAISEPRPAVAQKCLDFWGSFPNLDLIDPGTSIDPIVGREVADYAVRSSLLSSGEKPDDSKDGRDHGSGFHSNVEQA